MDPNTRLLPPIEITIKVDSHPPKTITMHRQSDHCTMDWNAILYHLAQHHSFITNPRIYSNAFPGELTPLTWSPEALRKLLQHPSPALLVLADNDRALHPRENTNSVRPLTSTAHCFQADLCPSMNYADFLEHARALCKVHDAVLVEMTVLRSSSGHRVIVLHCEQQYRELCGGGVRKVDIICHCKELPDCASVKGGGFLGGKVPRCCFCKPVRYVLDCPPLTPLWLTRRNCSSKL
ncbi:hypothetical protein FN846DRAFT_1019232 [Sphaerosporella brunnea]|uniref:Uncharacterized protein n=1 Tax=Sphaerosporella brunnea TaxID=1250544 RepID=A0A5J5F726_9PEZI|nr:hypothetical protein FN846DRAFT_1019232 [Sphaerosporella brunnea]